MLRSPSRRNVSGEHGRQLMVMRLRSQASPSLAFPSALCRLVPKHIFTLLQLETHEVNE